ncbi:S24 family peptidase [Methyloversatilis universalis]|uniref:S24 family peptidase n=1 Tax=Methyloversatilis universalis TaxID=378211 RepID=UPI00037E7728|nr:S24 family peptidase [Methyloversatilis universalis]
MAVSNITSTTCRPEPLLPPSAVFEHFSDRATQITGRMPDNSMAPKIEEGDLLQIEPCSRISTGGYTYAFEVGGRQFVRSLMKCADGSIQVIAENQHYENERIEEPEIKLIGRVVGVLQYRRVI